MSDVGATHEEQIDALNDVVSDLVQLIDRLKKEAFDYRDGFIEANAEVEQLKKDVRALEEGLYHDRVKIDALEELQKAAEDIDLIPREWVYPELRPKVSALHKAIRKVRGM